MRLFVNQDTGGLIAAFNFPEALVGPVGQNSLSVKRGDTPPLAYQFGSAYGAPLEIDLAATITAFKFGAKAHGDFDGPYVVSNFNSGTLSGGTVFTDAATTSGTATLTSASAGFTAAAAGLAIAGAGIPAGTTIAAVVDAGTVTLSANATATAASVTITLTGVFAYVKTGGSRFTDAVTTSGSAALTSATAGFLPSDVGLPVAGAGIPGGVTISAVLSATSVTLSANATVTAAGVTITIAGRSPTYTVSPSFGTVPLNDLLIQGGVTQIVASEAARYALAGLALGNVVRQTSDQSYWMVADTANLANAAGWSDDAPELDLVSLDAEVEVTQGSQVTSTLTFTLVVYNDVNKGSESAPAASPNPDYSAALALAGTALQPTQVAALVGTGPGKIASGAVARGAKEGSITEFGSLVALTDRFTVNGAAGVFSLNALGQITTAKSNANTFADFLQLPIPFVREAWTARLTYSMAAILPGSYSGGSVINASYGLALCLKSINPYSTAPDYQTVLNTNTANLGLLEIIQGAGAASLGEGTNGTFGVVAGDTLQLEIKRRGVSLYFTGRNLTQGCSKTLAIVSNLQSSQSPNFPFPNTSNLAIVCRSGSATILDFEFVSDSLAAPDLFVVGDSKAFGAAAGILEGRWANIVSRQLGLTLRVEAGGGDRTVEAAQTIPLLQLAPRYCINAIGFNDIASGVPTATWQANYQAVTAHMLAWDGKVFHLLPIPSANGTDTSALRAWQLATYPGLCIDPAAGFNLATMLDADNVHPNALGHTYVASVVQAFLAANP